MCLSCAWSMVQEYERFRYVVFFFEKGPFHLLSFLSFMKKYLIHQSSKGWKARSTALCSISGISIHHLAAEWVSGLVSCPIVLWASPIILYFHQDASFDAVEPTSNSFDIVVTLTILYVRSLGCHSECFGLVCHIVRINEIMRPMWQTHRRSFKNVCLLRGVRDWNSK